jgi:hypothetical protein
MCRSRHAITVNKVEEVDYSPSSAEVDQAINAQRGLKTYLRQGDLLQGAGRHHWTWHDAKPRALKCLTNYTINRCFVMLGIGGAKTANPHERLRGRR